MNIDEVMRVANDFGFSPLLRHVIEQHVAEAVKAEREAIASIGDERAKALLSVIGLAVVPSVVIQRDRAEQWRLYAAAIRARADNEVTK